LEDRRIPSLAGDYSPWRWLLSRAVEGVSRWHRNCRQVRALAQLRMEVRCLMRYRALACDYDGTLALHGRVDEPTVSALERLLASGRKLLLVTGRELPELQGIFPQMDLFARVVC